MRGGKIPKIAFKITSVAYPHKKRLRPDSSEPRGRDTNDVTELCDNHAIFLLATPIFSSYEKPFALPGGGGGECATGEEERQRQRCTFVTRHDNECKLTEVDDEVATLMGHLPQEMIGATIFKFLHPDEHELLLDIHAKILGESFAEILRFFHSFFVIFSTMEY